MFENIKLVKCRASKPAILAACLIDKSPSIVIGQLFIALAPIVTMRLGTSTEKIDGKDKASVKRYAKNPTAPVCLNP